MRTPVAVFAYNRPEHTEAALDALEHCARLDECEAHIFCDGPKNEAQQPAVDATRRVVRAWAVRHAARVVERAENRGLAASIVGGVTDLCRECGRVIVIEDDLVVAPRFIDYMLQSLDRYQGDEQVYQVSGYMFPVRHPKRPDAFFLPLTTTWGWATWDRAWRNFDWKASGALERLADPAVSRRFDLDDAYPYAFMLRSRLAGQNQSWGILWWWAIFSAGGLVLYPRVSLVRNIGFDGSGTHCGRDPSAMTREAHGFPLVWKKGRIEFPADISSDPENIERVKTSLRILAGGNPRTDATGRHLTTKVGIIVRRLARQFLTWSAK